MIKLFYGYLAMVTSIIFSACQPTPPPATPAQNTVDCEVTLTFEGPAQISYPSLWLSSNCAQSFIQGANSPLCSLEENLITGCDPNQGTLCPSNQHVVELEITGLNGHYEVINVTNNTPQGGAPDCPIIVQVPTDQGVEIKATWFDVCCPDLGDGRRIVWATFMGTEGFITQQAAQADNAFTTVSLRYTGTQSYPCN